MARPMKQMRWVLLVALATPLHGSHADAANSPFVVPVATQAMAAVPVAAVSTSIAKSIARFFGKEGTEEASEYLAQRGGRELMERVAAAASREGGEAAVDRVAKLTAEHGPEALAALDNAPQMLPVLNALDSLPPAEVKQSLVRLAAGSSGRELAESVQRYGTAALRSELRHPGVGLTLVKSLGDDGAELAARLTDDQAITVARHADSIATLPAQQRQGVLALLHSDADRMVRFMGRFAEANPGKTLFTAATTAIILAEPERILGGDEIVYDAEGNPILMSKAGLLGRTFDAGGSVAEHISERYVRPLLFAIAAFIGAFVGLLAVLKLWHVHRRDQLKTRHMAAETKAIGEPADRRLP